MKRNGPSICIKSFLLSGVFFVFFSGLAAAAETRIIELTDGSTLTGEVVSLADGVYTVRSNALGTIKINEAKVRAIRLKGKVQAATGDIKSLQDSMLGQADIMGLIQGLQNDPEFQKVLADPEIMKAAQAGDIATLMSNPKFMRLMNNQTVREIQKKLAP